MALEEKEEKIHESNIETGKGVEVGGELRYTFLILEKSRETRKM